MPKNRIKNHGFQKKPDLSFRNNRNRKLKASDLNAAHPIFLPFRPSKQNPKLAFVLAVILLLATLTEVTAKADNKSNKPKNSKKIKNNQTRLALNTKVCLPKAHFSKNIPPPGKKQCVLEDEIYIGTDVIKNVNEIRDAKVVVFGEIHTEVRDHQLQMRMLDILRQQEPNIRHTVLLESLSGNRTIPCEKIVHCVYPKVNRIHPLLFQFPEKINKSDKEKLATAVCETNEHVKYSTSNPIPFTFNKGEQFNCRGWDTEEGLDALKLFYSLVEKAGNMEKFIKKDMTEFTKKITSLYDTFKINSNMHHFKKETSKQVKDLLKLLETKKEIFSDIIQPEQQQFNQILNELKPSRNDRRGANEQTSNQNNLKAENHFTQLNKIASAIKKKITDHIMKIFEQGKNIMDANGNVNINRNKGMIKAIEQLKNQPGKTIVITGEGHVVQRTNLQSAGKPEDLINEVRNYLKDIPHAIVLPTRQKQSLKL